MFDFRFVILHHQTVKGAHWDIMLETDNALSAWSIPPQERTGQAFVCSAKQLPDHRKHYLDYEGIVSNDRGTVYQVDAGMYQRQSTSKFVIHGALFFGMLTINAAAEFVPLDRTSQ